jgi:hypothetical protein
MDDPYFLRTPHSCCYIVDERTVALYRYTYTSSIIDQRRRLRAPTRPDSSHDQHGYYLEQALITPQS